MSIPVVGVPTPPIPSRSQSWQGGSRDRQGAEFHLAPFKGGLELIPYLVGHLSGAPAVIVVVFDKTPASTLPLCASRPITRGPVDVDVAVGVVVAETFSFRSVPPPHGQRWGHWSLPLPLSWQQGLTKMTMKMVTSLSRRRRRRQGEDGEL